MASDMMKIESERSLDEKRKVYRAASSLTVEEKRKLLNKLYAEWVQDNNYDKDMTVLGYTGHIRIVDLVSQYIPDKSARLLDGGCGTGLLGQELYRRGYHAADGLDPFTECLDASREKGVYANYICESLGQNRLPIQDDTYDGICMTAAVGNIHIQLDCFPELIRITKPGGYIIFNVAEANIVDGQTCGSGKLDDCLHKTAAKGCWEYLEKRRNVLLKSRSDGQIEYCYAFVLRIL